MKCHCGNKLFYIQDIPCCDDCNQNPAYLNGKYIYDEKEIEDKELERTGVQDNGECNLGLAYGSGCYQFICAECRMKHHLAVSDGC